MVFLDLDTYYKYPEYHGLLFMLYILIGQHDHLVGIGVKTVQRIGSVGHTLHSVLPRTHRWVPLSSFRWIFYQRKGTRRWASNSKYDEHCSTTLSCLNWTPCRSEDNNFGFIIALKRNNRNNMISCTMKVIMAHYSNNDTYVWINLVGESIIVFSIFTACRLLVQVRSGCWACGGWRRTINITIWTRNQNHGLNHGCLRWHRLVVNVFQSWTATVAD